MEEKRQKEILDYFIERGAFIMSKPFNEEKDYITYIVANEYEGMRQEVKISREQIYSYDAETRKYLVFKDIIQEEAEKQFRIKPPLTIASDY